VKPIISKGHSSERFCFFFSFLYSHKLHRKICNGPRKKCFTSISVVPKTRNSNLIRITSFWRSCYFWEENVFRGPLQNFLWTSWLYSRYLKGSPKVVLYVSKTIMTVRRINTIVCQEKWKKFGFWNLKLKLWLEYSDKTTVFEVKLFFSRASRNFSKYLMTMFEVSRESAKTSSLHR